MTQELQEKMVRPLQRRYGERLRAVVAFGSVAVGRDQPSSDLDLLVVVTGLPGQRLQRVPEIATLRRDLEESRPLDILLVTPEECAANFENHNPLYLDIAFDGIVLFDRDVVAQLMEDTRAYVARRGIIRRKTGWKFPVEYRRPTPLSEVTNGDWAKVWIEDAVRDLEAAHLVKEQGLYEKAVYHCQQAVEKRIKAILICWGEFEKSHYVSSTLVERLSEQNIDPEWKEKLETVAEIGRDIEPEVSLSRYPGRMGDTWWIPAEEYDEAKAADRIEKTRFVVKVAQDFVSWWFNPEEDEPEDAV